MKSKGTVPYPQKDQSSEHAAKHQDIQVVPVATLIK